MIDFTKTASLIEIGENLSYRIVELRRKSSVDDELRKRGFFVLILSLCELILQRLEVEIGENLSYRRCESRRWKFERISPVEY